VLEAGSITPGTQIGSPLPFQVCRCNSFEYGVASLQIRLWELPAVKQIILWCSPMDIFF